MSKGFFDIVPIKKEKEQNRKLIVHFATKEDLIDFSKLINQKITLKTNNIFYPSAIKSNLDFKEYTKLVNQDLNSKIDKVEPWDNYWKGMPEFIQNDLSPLKTITINFKSKDDYQKFSKLVNQKLTNKTQSIWYPEAKITRIVDKRYIVNRRKQINPKYPVYIISKGRWESRQTSKALEKMKVPYHIVIESQEYDNYASVIDPNKILVLPFKNLGQGSIPARNWVWEHSVSIGAKRHWIMDDNLDGFYRFNNNLKLPCLTGICFKSIEDFSDRYGNISVSGLGYFMFVKRKYKIPPIIFNTRIYSCILIRNDLKHKWRGRYNEDTDLCIRALKSGDCTALFNSFLAMKTTTMTMKGGNTEDLYEIEDGRLKMAKSLQEQHPDIVKVSQKFGRYQHHVDYSSFKKNKLILKKGLKIPQGINNYGMVLQQLVNGKWIEKELDE